MANDFRKALTAAVETAAKNLAFRKAAQEGLTAIMAAGVVLIAKKAQTINESPTISPVTMVSDETLADDVEADPGMATLGEIEESIQRVERVIVSFAHRNSGRDVRDDRCGFPPYQFVNKVSDDFTVSDLIRRRFSDYERHNIKAIVKNSRNEIMYGGTRLREVRKTFDA